MLQTRIEIPMPIGSDALRRHGRYVETTTAIQCEARDGLPSLDNCEARAE